MSQDPSKKMNKITVLSLFDGISVAQQALKDLGYNVTYFASEIDKYAIAQTQKNHPETIQLGSVTEVYGDPLALKENPQYLFYKNKNGIMNSFHTGGIDLLVGGSPCQDLSIAKNNRKGLDGEKSGLFWEYVRILKEVKPRYFLLENVNSMSKEAKQTITDTLGVEPIMINAALVSAQSRKRLFWTNIPNVQLPEDRHIYLKDIILDGETNDLKSLCITATYHKKNEQNYIKKRDGQMIKIGNIGSNSQSQRVYSPEGKSVTLSALGGGAGAKTGLYVVPVALRNRGKGKQAEYNASDKANSMTTVQIDSMVEVDSVLRKLHPIECERLQSLPDNYTEGASNSQRYKMLGNAFNKDVIQHILANI